MKFYLLVLVGFLSACSLGMDGSPCDGPTITNTYDKLDSCIGTYYLSDSSLFWVSKDTNYHPIFVNNDGFKSMFSLTSKNYISTYTEKLNYKSRIIEKPCGSSDLERSYNYAKKCNDYVKYSANNLDFYFQYLRYNELIPKYINDSTYDIKSNDYLTITFYATWKYNLTFNVNFNKANSLNCVYHDTITLRGKLYSDIYNYCIDTTKIDNNYIQPIGLYVNKEIGLLGFYFNDGDKWIKE